MSNDKLDKITDVLAALVDENTILRKQMGDILAQRKDYAADIRDLKSSIDTTRRALDPEVLGEHVSNNMNEIMGDTTQIFMEGVNDQLDIAKAIAPIPDHLTKQIESLSKKEDQLERIAKDIEKNTERRSKWDFRALLGAMVVTGLLAGTAAYYIAKDKLKNTIFNTAIQTIQADKDASSCNRAQGTIFKSNDTHYCGIKMEKYQGEE